MDALGTDQVRTPGAEWLLVRSRPNLSKPWRPVEGEVWRRVTNGDWRRVQVPQPLFPTDGVSEPLVPVSMIAVGDEVWLLAYYHSQHPKSRNRAGRGVLLSNVYREPCDLNRDTDCAGRLARYP